MTTETKAPDTVTLDEDHIHTIQELLTAVYDLPGVADKVDAWLRGRGFEDPQENIRDLRKQIF